MGINDDTAEPLPSRDNKGKFVKGNKYGFKPGESGNLRGRRDALADWLNRVGDEVLPSGMTKHEHLARRAWELILSDRTPPSVVVHLIVWMTNRTDPIVRQALAARDSQIGDEKIWLKRAQRELEKVRQWLRNQENPEV